MNLGQSDDSLILWREDDDSSTGNDFEYINHWNELDGDYIGDMLNEDKEDNTTRVYFQNLNGLNWDKHGGIWPMICQSMAAVHADIACFSEVNQDTSKFEIGEKMKTATSLQFDHVHCDASIGRTVNRRPGVGCLKCGCWRSCGRFPYQRSSHRISTVGAYQTGKNRFSKDPLALVTWQDDPLWSKFVFWIVGCIFYAEEQNITQPEADLLPTVSLFGPLFLDMFPLAIGAVGNYGEIYRGHAQPDVPRGGLNELNYPWNGPQQFPLPGVV